jgi:hypothetical protein
MRTHARVLVGAAALALTVWFLGGAGNAGSGKENPFKPILPKETYQELAKRAIKEIQRDINSKDEDTVKKTSGTALLLAAYTLSTNGDKAGLAKLRQAALDIAEGIEKDKLGDAKNAAGTLANPTKPAGKEAENPGPLSKYVEDLGKIMDPFKQKEKGGEGLPDSLYLNPKLKKLNGIEELVRELARKKPAPATLAKAKDELVPLAYRLAVVGSITHQYAPNAKQGEKDPEDWRRWSINMRDAAVELAEAAKKGDVEEVNKAATRLNTSCTQCHGIFRPN